MHRLQLMLTQHSTAPVLPCSLEENIPELRNLYDISVYPSSIPFAAELISDSCSWLAVSAANAHEQWLHEQAARQFAVADPHFVAEEGRQITANANH